MTASDRLMALVLVGGLAGGAAWRLNGAPSQPPARPQVNWLAVCDGSDSGTGQGCTPASLATVAGRWVRAAAGRPGSTFTVMGVGTTRDGAAVLFQRRVPNGWGANAVAARQGFVRDLERDLGAMTITASGSALVEALQVAARRLAESPGAHRLVVMSDLRQVTRGVWNFERELPRAPSFQAWIDEQHLRATLPMGSVLFVCGVHSLRGPARRAQSARMDERRRALWGDVFARMGVGPVDLHAACDDATLAAADHGP
ncbi:MAG: hypothetical protein Q8S73_20320 [Deltaproteobacteria bacterium]|nr:hypothetical protein [Myxococcales bacterium]MDP3216465.1 hypothetical protein [Deltaproteobacteria bacterium]